MEKECVEEVACWSDAKEELLELRQSNPNTVFRGQKDAGWDLKSTFLRLAEENHLKEVRRRETVEKQLLEEFAAEAIRLGFIRDDRFTLRGKEADPKLRAYAQHHGMPTILLDWTQSPYVALFFAFDGLNTLPLSNKTKAVSVWCLNVDDLTEGTIAFGKSLAADPGLSEGDAQRTFRAQRSSAVEFYFGLSTDNQRMLMQRGCFTQGYYEIYNPDLDGFEQYLEQHSEFPKSTLRQVCIPTSCREEALEDLRLMGLDGGHLMVSVDHIAATVLRRMAL